MLRVSQLSRAFGQTVALNRLTFAVDEGEVVALVGPNGSGKTTTLRCVLGLLNFDGQITVAGLDARRRGREVRRLVGYLPQAPAFHDDLTVAETIHYYARLRGLGQKDAAEAAALAGVVDFARRRAGGLSGGMRQRLALAVALLGSPPLLLLDEPTSNLDAESRQRFTEALQALKAQGRTILMATHSLGRLQPLVSKAVMLVDGRAVFQGPPESLPGEVLDLAPSTDKGGMSRLWAPLEVKS